MVRLDSYSYWKGHPAKTNGQRYAAVGSTGNLQAVADVLHKAFPERSGLMKTGEPGIGYPKDFKSKRIDGSKAVLETGKPWIDFEQTVVDTAKALQPYLPNKS